MVVRILVVDDDRCIVKTTCDILRLKGHEAFAAYSGEEGVAQARTVLPDFVLMDFRMQGISGVEALKLMKASAPGLPVILVSACVTDELLEAARLAGADSVLSKPLDIQNVFSFLDLIAARL